MIETMYPINDCYPCVQGEGAQTGVAMVLLRLHGCAVGCPWCDTKETWDTLPHHEKATLAEALGTNAHYAYVSDKTIAQHIQSQHSGPRWVLVTGGEPAQYELGALVNSLHESGYKVAIETSGTETGQIGAGFDWVCVSPKLNMPGGKPFLPHTLETADEIKMVIGKQADIDALSALLAQVTLKPEAQICLQPVSMSQKATQLCLDVVQQRGWRLSLQTHKFLDIR